MLMFCKPINVQVPEAKCKRHDVLAVSNASQVASKLRLQTNTSRGKLTSGFQVNAQVFSCRTESVFYVFASSTHKSEPFISHRCASVSSTGKQVRQLMWMISLGPSGTSQSCWQEGEWSCLTGTLLWNQGIIVASQELLSSGSA